MSYPPALPDELRGPDPWFLLPPKQYLRRPWIKICLDARHHGSLAFSRSEGLAFLFSSPLPSFRLISLSVFWILTFS